MRATDRDLEPYEDDAGQVARLGPPGWAEFSAARERFIQTVSVAGLESAWDAPALDPPRPDQGGGPTRC